MTGRADIAAPSPLESEPTEIGEQTLVTGVRPVTLGDRLALRAAAPIAPKRNPDARQKPCDLGLFDEVGRAQTDLVDLLKATSPSDSAAEP